MVAVETKTLFQRDTKMNKLSTTSTMNYLLTIYELQTTGDCDGLWIGNLNDNAKETLVDLGLIEMTRIDNYDQFGNVESTDQYWVLSDWGYAIVEKLEKSKR